MPYYLYQAAYTAEALKTLTRKPANRFEVIRKAVSELGGTLEGGWFSLGEYDVVLLLQMPNNVSAAALSLAAAAGGAVQRGKTTALMSVEEGLTAMRKAGQSSYKPPAR